MADYLLLMYNDVPEGQRRVVCLEVYLMDESQPRVLFFSSVVLVVFGIPLAAAVGCARSDVPAAGGTAGAGGSAAGTGGAVGDGAGGLGGSGGAGGGGTGAGGAAGLMVGAGGGGAAGASGGAGAPPACPDAIPAASNTTPCRGDADCPNTYYCTSSYTPRACGGACIGAPHRCTTDGDCGTGKVCVPAPNPCGCPISTEGPGTMCVPRCTSTSCAADEACDDSDGHCKPALCSAGFACGPAAMTASSLWVCAPSRVGADAHGCAAAKCASDGYTCPAGWVCGPGDWLTLNGCSAVSCVGGQFHCPVNTDCNPSSNAPHHCGPRGCTTDRNCDCGVCIQGACRSSLWVCAPPAPA
jgi:hypothetical protein